MKLRIISMLVFFLISFGTILYFSPNVKSSGNEIYVDVEYFGSSDGTADRPYDTIQEAINVANEGDTIYVFGGFYEENLKIDKKLKIVGGIDEVETIIDSKTDYRYLVEVTGDEVTLERLTLSDSNDKTPSPIGALVYLKSNNNIINRNNIITTKSYGIYLDLTSSGNFISNNIINNTKVGIYSYSPSTLDIYNNKITNCSNYGIYINSDFSNTRIYQNYIYNCDTGIYVKSNGATNITNNIISAQTYYGVYLYNTENSLVQDNNFYSNSGDGVYLNNADSSVVKNNYFNKNLGNSIYLLYSSDCTISDNTFENNMRCIGLVASNNIIKNNRFYNSSGSSVYAQTGCSNNKIYLNDFKGNVVSAKDLGSNIWYYENHGNYWSDYGYVDRDLDGIGDASYSKNGVSDSYPLGYFLKPPKKPSKSDIDPKDGEDEVSLDVTLSVHVEDPDSDELTVYFYNAKDDTLISSGTKNPVLNVKSGSTVKYNFKLGFNTTYAWYVIVDDGLLQNQSDPFLFFTDRTPPDNDPPVAKAGGIYTGDAKKEIIFDASDSYDPDGKIDFYRWNFGDGTSEILKNYTTHKYENEGTYQVTLTVIDNNGSSDIESTTAIIGSYSNIPPVASFNIPSTGYINEKITFTSTSSDPDKDNLIETWKIDNTTLNGREVSYTFKKIGVYIINLTVSDGIEEKTITDFITIKAEREKGSKKSPGFELVVFFISLAVILSILRKKTKII